MLIFLGGSSFIAAPFVFPLGAEVVVEEQAATSDVIIKKATDFIQIFFFIPIAPHAPVF
ncbi:hypothetical protein D3C86_2206990 [compost metagenome]